MEVHRFREAEHYEFWIEHLKSPIEIISLVVFNDEIVVTFKRN